MKVTRICPNCGKEFETLDRKEKTTIYCCRECYNQHKGIGVKKYLTCQVCGKEFEYVHGKGTKTCSKECANKLKSILFSTKEEDKPKAKCLNCGKEFTYDKYKSVRLDLKPKFCNNSCYFEYLKTHSKEVFDHSKQIEEAHETRTCEMCGKEFYVYKKTKKRFCSDECRVKYCRTKEFQEKKAKTMMEKYGTLSLGGNSAATSEKYFVERNKKYLDLCEKSNVELLGYESMHVLRVKCKKCGKEFITNNLSYIQYDHIACKHCSDEYKLYKPAIKLYDVLEENGVEYLKNDRTIIKPYELDIYIPQFSLAIEINGNFWHSELCGKDKNYHIQKTKLCNDKGIKLIHIFEDEIEFKFDIVKSRILNLLHKSKENIYARKCKVIEIDNKTKKQFIETTHIQSDANSSINLGLIYNDELVSVMTFSNERIIYGGKCKDGYYEMLRFSNKLYTNVIGGFSKLLSYFVKTYKPKRIKTYADCRWSGMDETKTVYNKNGFIFDGLTKPNYWYINKLNCLIRKHRYSFTKYSILKKNPTMDKNKTEWELMQEMGYNRLWDCGNMKFVLYEIKN